jgi:hypothetical protein
MTDHASAPDLTDERLAAHVRAADLSGLPWTERLRRVREDRGFATPSFIELGISLGREIELSPVDRERWAQLAVEAAMRARSRRAEQLEPLAWAVLGNAHRVRGKLSAGRSAFIHCHALRCRMTDPLELADTLSFEASYWSAIAFWSSRSQWAGRCGNDGRKALVKAAELMDVALDGATGVATDSVIGRYEIQAGQIANEAGRWSVAMTMLFSALDRIDPGNHPRLAVIASEHLAKTACECGLLDAAMAGIVRLQGIYERVPDPKVRLFRDWLVADITAKLGRVGEAERLLHEVRAGFMERGFPFEAGLADLETAELAAATDRWSAATQLRSRGFHTLRAGAAQ